MMRKFILYLLLCSFAFAIGVMSGPYGRVVLGIIISSFGMTTITKTIYVDIAFDDNEYQAIVAAGAEWSYATKKLVKFNFVRGINQNTYNSIRNDPDKIAMFKINDGDNSTARIDEYFKDKKVGCYMRHDNTQLIYIIISRIYDYGLMEKVIAHEYGHALGIGHVNKDKDLMNEFIDEDVRITKDDIKELCKLYLCNPNHY